MFLASSICWVSPPWDSPGSVLLSSAGCEWVEAWHEEVETWEGDHVDGQFPEIGVQLTWESQTGGDSRHSGRDEMVQVAVGWGGQLECSEADIVKGLVVNAEGLVFVLNKLVD